MANKISKMYHLQFFETVDGSKDYYFSSIPGMYEKFSKEQIGIAQDTLLNNPPKVDNPRSTRKSVIYRLDLYRFSKK